MPAVNINLLPIDLSAKSGTSKTAATLKRVALTSLGVFLTFGVIAAVFMILFSFQIDSIAKSNEELKTQISSLESVEQKNVLVKDRLAKIKQIDGVKDILPALVGLSTFLNNLPSGASITDADIDASGRIKFEIRATDSSALPNVLANLASLPNYKKMVIKTFTYTPTIGYQIGLEASL